MVSSSGTVSIRRSSLDLGVLYTFVKLLGVVMVVAAVGDIFDFTGTPMESRNNCLTNIAWLCRSTFSVTGR